MSTRVSYVSDIGSGYSVAQEYNGHADAITRSIARKRRWDVANVRYEGESTGGYPDSRREQ
jgi:hypothetical protein